MIPQIQHPTNDHYATELVANSGCFSSIRRNYNHTSEPTHKNYTTINSRLNSFNEWHKNHYLSPKALASAGFIHTHQIPQKNFWSFCVKVKTTKFDLVYCYHCNLGAYAWEPGENPWIEHARWSPNCKFIQNRIGVNFVAVVRHLRDFRGDYPITLETVIAELEKRGMTYDKYSLLCRDNWEQDPAVLALRDYGFKPTAILESCYRITNNNDSLSVGALYDDLISHNVFPCQQLIEKELHEVNEKEEDSDALKKKIDEYRQEHECKICLNKGADIIFIPCGHLAACMQCASNIVDLCPVCRKKFKKFIRAYFN